MLDVQSTHREYGVSMSLKKQKVMIGWILRSVSYIYLCAVLLTYRYGTELHNSKIQVSSSHSTIVPHNEMHINNKLVIVDRVSGGLFIFILMACIAMLFKLGNPTYFDLIRVLLIPVSSGITGAWYLSDTGYQLCEAV